MTVASNLFSTLVLIALPTPKDELGPGLDFRLLVKFLAPVASAIGIWTVGNIGREQGPIKVISLIFFPYSDVTVKTG